MQPLTNMEQKWKIVDSVISDIESLQKTENNENIERLNETFKKLLRVKSLKQNIDKDEQELKLEYVVLMRERNLYFEKLKQIQKLGSDNNWKDKGGLLGDINSILFNSGKSDKLTS